MLQSYKARCVGCVAWHMSRALYFFFSFFSARFVCTDVNYELRYALRFVYCLIGGDSKSIHEWCTQHAHKTRQCVVSLVGKYWVSTECVEYSCSIAISHSVHKHCNHQTKPNQQHCLYSPTQVPKCQACTTILNRQRNKAMKNISIQHTVPSSKGRFNS